MNRSALTTIFGTIGLAVCAAVQAQSTPQPGPSTSTPSSTNNSADSSMSPSKPASGHKDTSRAAKEQQSQKQKCPKNGDNSNVNCKERSANQSPK